jgi:3-oxoacyl-[acyl-carrier protein] reductase
VKLNELAAALPGGPHLVKAFDVRDEDAWLAYGEELAAEGEVGGVVTAAATLAPIGPLGTWPIDAFRDTLDTNVVGTLLAVQTFLGPLRATHGAVVTFSGGGATAAMPNYDAYAASKAAIVRLTENLAAELRRDDVRVNSIAPGFVLSAMHIETVAAGPEAAGQEYYDRTRRALESKEGDSPALAAELVDFLLSPSSVGITGRLISARWDPWREPAFQGRLRSEPHFATLRRIDDHFFRANS